MENNIDRAYYGSKVSLLVQTRNYEEGESVEVIVEKNIDGKKNDVSFAGNVNKDGFAELKEKIEVNKNI